MADTKLNVIFQLKDKASKGIKSIGGKLKDFASGVVSSRLSVIALTTAIGYQLKAFADLETSIANVATLYGGTTRDIDRMMSDVLEISKELPVAAKDLADAYFDVVSAGVSVKDSAQFLKEAAKLAVAGVTDTKTTVDGLTSTMNAYGMSVEDVGKISDLFFTAQKKGKTTIAELSGTIGRVAPIAESAGIELEELLGSISAITLKGIKTSEAVTGLKAAISNIIKPSKEASDMADELGFQFDAQALKSRGLKDMLKLVIEETDRNDDAMTKLFGSVEALNTVIALSTNDFQALDDVMGDLETSAGATEEALKTQADTVANQFKIMMNNINTAAMGVTQTFKPAIVGVLKAINSLWNRNAEILQEFEDKVKEYSLNDIKKEHEKLATDLNRLNTAHIGVMTSLTTNYTDVFSDFSGVRRMEIEQEMEEIRGKLEALNVKKAELLQEDLEATQEKAAEKISDAEQTNQQLKTLDLDFKTHSFGVDDKILEHIKKTNDARLINETEVTQALIDEYRKRADEMVANAQLGVTTAFDTFNQDRTKREDVESDHKKALRVLDEEYEKALSQDGADRAVLEKEYRQEQQRLEKTKNDKLKDLNDDLMKAIGEGMKVVLKKQVDVWVAGYLGDIAGWLAANWWNPLAYGAAAVAAIGVTAAGELAKSGIDSVQFAQGGIVPGTQYQGDQVKAGLNSGEMVLNKKQQAELFRMANSGGSRMASRAVYDSPAETQRVIILTDDGTQLAEGVYNIQSDMIRRGTLQERDA